MSALRYWVWLSMAGGAVSVKKVLAHFGSPEKAYFAEREDYIKVEGLGAREMGGFLNKSWSDALRAIDACADAGFQIITLGDAGYPERLKNIYDPPTVIYVRGRLPMLDDEAAIAVAGSRKCTPYGMKMAERMGFELTRAGCLVVSGLARGIDTAAARGALMAGGTAVGVIGSGLDVVYPPENAGLFDDLSAEGAIISEYPPGSEPNSRHFPARNRILSGVSVGVVIIEAPKKSGALITAAHALEQGRDVFAVPGNADAEASRGSNALLREGAFIALTGDDVASEYLTRFPRLQEAKRRAGGMQTPEFGEGIAPENAEFLAPAAPEPGKKHVDISENVEYIDIMKLTEGMSDDEKQVFLVIGGDKLHADEIIRGSGLPAGRALSALTMLEIAGRIKQLPGKYFILESIKK